MKDPYRDLIRPDSRFGPESISGYVASGEWRDVRLDDYLWQAADIRPDHLALVGYDVLGGRRRQLTYREYADATTQLSRGLASLGVGAGDTVAVMLPNVIEFAETIYAVSRLGAVYSGIPSSYGAREVSFILGRTGARVLVIPQQFRDRDFVSFVGQLLAAGTVLDHVVVVGGDGDLPPAGPWRSLDEVIEAGAGVELPPPPSVARLAHLGFTSGTTGEPKGVMNTHQTLDSVLQRWVEFMGSAIAGRDAVNLVASPIGHHTGFLWGVLLTASLQGTAVLMDRWDGARCAEIVRDEGVSIMLGAPAFLQDMLNLDEVPVGTWDSLQMISIPGAPIPRGLVPKAREALRCFICPAWGMTEYGIGISGTVDLPTDRVEATDGVAVPGCVVRVVGIDGELVAAGVEGDLQIQGAGLFMGYLDRPDFTAQAIEDEGWFDTGDRAIADSDGFISLVGRTKDIIIRGGENIPVVEVETLLYDHPAVFDAAVVGIPDERLGERACACVVVRPGHAIEGLSDLTGYLLERGLSKHFLPERLVILEALPRTMSGKVRKLELRDLARDAISGDNPAETR